MNVRELFDLKGKVAVVTGGAVGLGREIAQGLAEARAHLVLCSRKKERCDTAYSASKGGGIISLTRDLAVQWSKYGIRTNAVAPGFFPTNMTDLAIRKYGDSMRQRIPLGRFGGEDDLKGVIVFLSSPLLSSPLLLLHTSLVRR